MTIKKNPFKQLPLNFKTGCSAEFTNFIPGRNTQLLKFLQALDSNSCNQIVYIYGPESSGKTHLLNAVYQNFNTCNRNAAFYLPLKESCNLNQATFDNLEDYALLCLDDIDAIIGNATLEEALFHCYNKIFMHGKNLIVTSRATPKNASYKLADLQSRLSGALTFALKPLLDEEKLLMLTTRAKQIGLSLPPAVSSFLLKHSQRDLKTLLNNLEKLAAATLQSKKLITIPLVKNILST